MFILIISSAREVPPSCVHGELGYKWREDTGHSFISAGHTWLLTFTLPFRMWFIWTALETITQKIFFPLRDYLTSVIVSNSPSQKRQSPVTSRKKASNFSCCCVPKNLMGFLGIDRALEDTGSLWQSNEVNAVLNSLSLVPDSFRLQFKFSGFSWVRFLYNHINKFCTFSVLLDWVAFCFQHVGPKVYYNCRQTQNTIPLNGLVESLLKHLLNSNNWAAGDSISLLLDQLLQTVCKAYAARWESSAVRDITKHRWDWCCEYMENNSSGSMCSFDRNVSSKRCNQLEPSPY